MRILYLGDVRGEPGLRLVERLLPDLKKQHAVDAVIAQAENLSDGKGVRPADFERLRGAGVDFCTGGNHILFLDDVLPLINDPAAPIIRPANYLPGTPGFGYKYFETTLGKVLVISLLGHIVGRDAEVPTDNPLQIVDRILDSEQHTERLATIVNFHGDYSSEKRIIGYYLDGRVTAVVGDHWHIQTNDAEVLPGGTAHITDVGMCGSLDSSLGVQLQPLIARWRDGRVNRNTLETTGRMQLNALLIDIDQRTHLAHQVRTIRQTLT